MAAPKVTTSAEKAKRELVKSIAEQGRTAIRNSKELAAPNTYLAQAGRAAAKADPVDLGGAGIRAASNIASGPAQDQQRYGSAVDAIFADQLDSMKGSYDERLSRGHTNILAGTNAELGRYDTALAEQAAAEEAARRAAASYGGGGGRRYGGGGGGGAEPEFEPEGGYSAGRENAPDLINLEPVRRASSLIAANQNAFAAAEGTVSEMYFQGATLEEALSAASRVFGSYRLDSATWTSLLSALRGSWATQFHQHERRPYRSTFNEGFRR